MGLVYIFSLFIGGQLAWFMEKNMVNHLKVMTLVVNE